jgi:hypothetical protein
VTEEQHLKSVDAQLVLLERKQTNTLLCPWCDKSSKLGERICCEAMANAFNRLLDRREDDRVAAYRITLVEQQIADAIERAKRGEESQSFLCPYCLEETRIKDGERYCCEKFRNTVQAIVERRKIMREVETVKKVAEKVAQEAARPIVTL